jgi:transcriptional regulator with XRE-family HTH domain
MSFADWLVPARRRLDLTQEQLAEKSGLSVRAIRDLERGSSRPRRSTVTLLAEALGTPYQPSPGEPPRRAAQETSAGASGSPRGPAEGPVPSQLPRDIPDFVGRDAAVADVVAALASGSAAMPLVAVSGLGGIGKTTLAVHCSHLCRDRFPDGQLYVSLRGASHAPEEPSLVLARLLRALGVPPARVPTDPDDQSALFRSLPADRAVLLVLDDAADSRQLRPLLPGGGACGVVVTSRRYLGGLEGARHVVLEPLDETEANSLFVTAGGDVAAAAPPRPVQEVLKHCAGLALTHVREGARDLARPCRLAALGLMEELGHPDTEELRAETA